MCVDILSFFVVVRCACVYWCHQYAHVHNCVVFVCFPVRAGIISVGQLSLGLFSLHQGGFGVLACFGQGNVTLGKCSAVVWNWVYVCAYTYVVFHSCMYTLFSLVCICVLFSLVCLYCSHSCICTVLTHRTHRVHCRPDLLRYLRAVRAAELR